MTLGNFLALMSQRSDCQAQGHCGRWGEGRSQSRPSGEKLRRERSKTRWWQVRGKIGQTEDLGKSESYFYYSLKPINQVLDGYVNTLKQKKMSLMPTCKNLVLFGVPVRLSQLSL